MIIIFINYLSIRYLAHMYTCWKILRQCKKAIVNHSDAFEKFASRLEIIIEKILQEIE